jgi:hypothetical protein
MSGTVPSMSAPVARGGQQVVGRQHAVDEAPGRRLLGVTQLPVNDTSRAR